MKFKSQICGGYKVAHFSSTMMSDVLEKAFVEHLSDPTYARNFFLDVWMQVGMTEMRIFSARRENGIWHQSIL